MEKSVTLLQARFDKHVSADAITDFEESFISQIDCEVIPQQPLRKLLVNVYRLADRSKILRKIIDFLFSLRSVDKNYFLVLMGIEQIRKAYPYFLFKSRSKSVYLFDCWEKNFEKTELLIKRLNISTVFFSSRQASEHFRKNLKNVQAMWLPEAANINKYSSLAYENRNIDIIQFGRKYEKYHQLIQSFCEENRLNYVYEKVNGDVIFPVREDFNKALSRSKISICFPSSLTHPERSGKVSTMTQRYLQSMASRCLIIGSMPEDMKELFDYCPIIEADMKNPADQLKNILSNYLTYLPLIEKNYTEVLLKHQWENRISVLKEKLKS
jgi:hypothetical protein